MKGFAILLGAALVISAASASAQDVPVLDFESAMPAWVTSGYPSTQLMSDGGANGTMGYARLIDAGWGATWALADAATPPAGKYRLQLYYRNGADKNPMKSLTFGVVENGTVKTEKTVPATQQTEWTQLQSDIFQLSGNPIKFTIANDQGATLDITADIDEVVLVPVTNAPLELTVWPTDSIYLSGQEAITATPKFGSETYTKVEFDVNNDGTVEYTATAAPFVFNWNTTDYVADTSRTQSADGNTPLELKITVTDSNSQTASVVEKYTVDNRWSGRQSIVVNGDFSQWQAADGNGNQLPVGWVEQNTTYTLPVYGPAPGRDAAAGEALKVQFTSFGATADPFPERYALRSIGVKGNYRDLQTYFWGLGSYCRLMYMVSSDGGITYKTTQQSAGEANSSTWKFAVQATPKNLGLTDSSYVAVGTHQLNTDENFWDDIVSQGIKYPETSTVGEWKLY